MIRTNNPCLLNISCHMERRYKASSLSAFQSKSAQNVAVFSGRHLKAKDALWLLYDMNFASESMGHTINGTPQSQLNSSATLAALHLLLGHLGSRSCGWLASRLVVIHISNFLQKGRAYRRTLAFLASFSFFSLLALVIAASRCC
jgi:hypothetical protein